MIDNWNKFGRAGLAITLGLVFAAGLLLGRASDGRGDGEAFAMSREGGRQVAWNGRAFGLDHAGPRQTRRAARLHIRPLAEINDRWRRLKDDARPIYAYTLLRRDAAAHVYLPHWSEVGEAKWCEAARHEIRHVLEGSFHR